MTPVEPSKSVSPAARRPAAAPQQQGNGTVGISKGDMATNVPPPTKPPRAETAARNWPLACSLLLLVQFLERLSFSFVTAVLAQHLHDNLGMNQGVADTCLQLLVQVTFFAPIVGAMLADAKYGKYGTLLSLFPIYLLGQLLISSSPFLPGPKFLHPYSLFLALFGRKSCFSLVSYLDFFALFLLAYACGCCRAVLAAYGADQIWPLNAPQLGCFFALFYAQEQLAIVCSSLLLPFLKSMVLWPLPLDKPLLGVLLLSVTLLWIAIAILVGLSRFFRQSLPQGQNVFGRSWRTFKHALHNKWRSRQKRLVVARPRQNVPKHLLDHFLDDHNCERDKECDFGRRQVCAQAKFLAEMKSVLRASLVLSPLPLFWALNSQMIALSTTQAQNADPRLPFLGPLLSIEQLQLLPRLLVLLFIPTFYLLIFPSASLARFCSLNTYLRRMSIGIFLTALACCLAASVQMLFDMSSSAPVQPTPDSALFKVFNLFPADCSVSVARMADTNTQELLQLPASQDSKPMPLLPGELSAGFADLQFRFNGSACAGHRKSRVRIWVTPGKLNLAVAGPQGISWSAIDARRAAAPGSGLSSLGILMLLPCNSLDSPLPAECANSSGDPLAALTPFASALSLCPSSAAQQSPDNSSADSNETSTAPTASSSTACPLSWTSDEAIPSQLFVFPPRGDNMGMGKGSLYQPKLVKAGTYKLTLMSPPSSADSSQPSASNDSLAADSPAANSSSNGLQGEITVDAADSGGIALVLVALDGSPLAGQNPALQLLHLAGPASLNIVWLFPQNLLMAAAEVLICVTGLEFCYSQAPNVLKATMLGQWYLTIYIGMFLCPQLSKLKLLFNPSYQLPLTVFSFFSIGIVFTLIAHFFFKYRENLTGALTTGSEPNREVGGLAEKLEGTLRASMARLPTKKVIKL